MQLNIPQEKEKALLDFSYKLAESLIKANKTVANSSRGRSTKTKSNVAKKKKKKKGKKVTVAIPCHDVRFNRVDHWPVANSGKNCCWKYQKYCRMVCEKCNIYLSLLEDRNCFKLFHI